MNSILTRHIDDAQVNTAQLAGNSVTAAKIQANAVGSSEIANNSITTTQLASGALGGKTMTGNITYSGQMVFNDKVGIQDSAPLQKLHIDEVAGFDVATISSSSTGQQTVDSFSATQFRTAKYLISVTNSTDGDYQALELLLFHDGTTVYLTQYASIFDNGAQVTFDADINSGNVRLRATPASTDNMTIKVLRQTIEV